MSDMVLCLNAWSSSIKFEAFSDASRFVGEINEGG